MPLRPIYRDFLTFLECWGGRGDPWRLFRELYWDPHRRFLEAYWAGRTGLGRQALRERVRRIRPGDYTLLQHWEAQGQILPRAESALRRSEEAFPWAEEPRVFLVVGFFSPDGFVLQLEGGSVIGLGMERYRTLEPLGLVLAHEIGHILQHQAGFGPPENATVGYKIVSEGLAAAAVARVWPRVSRHRSLLLKPDELGRLEEETSGLRSWAARSWHDPVPQGEEARRLPRGWDSYLGRELVETVLGKSVSWPELLPRLHERVAGPSPWRGS